MRKPASTLSGIESYFFRRQMTAHSRCQGRLVSRCSNQRVVSVHTLPIPYGHARGVFWSHQDAFKSKYADRGGELRHRNSGYFNSEIMTEHPV